MHCKRIHALFVCVCARVCMCTEHKISNNRIAATMLDGKLLIKLYIIRRHNQDK